MSHTITGCQGGLDCAFRDEHVHCPLDNTAIEVDRQSGDRDDVKSGGGERCAECSDIVCAGCITNNTPEGTRACRACADKLCDDAQAADEFSLYLERAIREVNAFVVHVSERPNDVEVLEQRTDLEHLEELVAIARRNFNARVGVAA